MSDVEVLEPTSVTEEPPPSPARRYLRRLAIGALVAVLVAELGARVLERWFLDAPDGFNLPHLDEQVAAMEAMAAQGGADVLVLGSSVAIGIHPDRLAELSEDYDTAFTAWVAGAPVRSLEVIYHQLADPTLDPDVVVIPLTSRELNSSGNGQQRNFRSLTTSPALGALTGDDSLLQRLDRRVAEHLAFFRLRPVLRDPGRLYLALRAGKLPAEAAGAWRIWEDPPTGFVSDPGHLEQERRALEGYELDGPELQALRRLVRDLKADGVRVILVNMPVLSEEYDPLHENGRADHEAYLAAFDRVCAELAPECLDTMDEEWGREWFANVNHVNVDGTERVTAMVAEALDRA